VKIEWLTMKPWKFFRRMQAFLKKNEHETKKVTAEGGMSVYCHHVGGLSQPALPRAFTGL
jgi:hypothetical protein